MEVHQYHSNITQKKHGASRNYRYVLDVSLHQPNMHIVLAFILLLALLCYLASILLGNVAEFKIFYAFTKIQLRRHLATSI